MPKSVEAVRLRIERFLLVDGLSLVSGSKFVVKLLCREGVLEAEDSAEVGIMNSRRGVGWRSGEESLILEFSGELLISLGQSNCFMNTTNTKTDRQQLRQS